MNRRQFLKRTWVSSAAAVFLLAGTATHAADPQPVTVLVVYHSASGNTEKMAHGIAEGGQGRLRYERRSKAGGRSDSR